VGGDSETSAGDGQSENGSGGETPDHGVVAGTADTLDDADTPGIQALESDETGSGDAVVSEDGTTDSDPSGSGDDAANEPADDGAGETDDPTREELANLPGTNPEDLTGADVGNGADDGDKADDAGDGDGSSGDLDEEAMADDEGSAAGSVADEEENPGDDETDRDRSG
jgi:hypothetical protein